MEEPKKKVVETHKFIGDEIVFYDDGVEVDRMKRKVAERWTRVMGYHRPVAEFNVGKKSEHDERVPFVEPRDLHGLS